MLGTLDFTGSLHLAPFNFPSSPQSNSLAKLLVDITNWTVNKTQIGSLGSDQTADRIGLWIGLDQTGTFAFVAEELF